MVEFNPFSPDFARDPYAVYAQLRAEAPVLQTPLQFWAVSRYDDVSFVLKNPQLFSSQGMGGPGGPGSVMSRTIINTDPPDHTYMRNLVNKAFTPRMVAELEPRIREIARDFIGRVVESGEMELVHDLAVPLPVTVIAEILGVEADRREDFKRWSNAFVGNATVTASPEATQKDRDEFYAYFEAAVAQRRATPSSDVLSVLIRADEGEGGRLTTEEIVAFAMLLLIAGNETTTNLIGNAMGALLDNQEQLDRVAADPTLIPNMVEEALRWDSPVQFLFRTTTQDLDISGVPVPKGSVVVPIYASANRDDARYPNGARFDIDRNTQGHLAFGLGPHFCLGAPLARLEARVAFEELFAACGEIRGSGDPVRLQSMFLRGMSAVPLAFASKT